MRDEPAINLCRNQFRDFPVHYVQVKLTLVRKERVCRWGHIDISARDHRLTMEKGRAGGSYMIAMGPQELRMKDSFFQDRSWRAC